MHRGHRWLSPTDYSCWSVSLKESLPHGDISVDDDGVRISRADTIEDGFS